MTTKKSTTSRDVSGAWDSYALSDEEAADIAATLTASAPHDNFILALLALLHSFTYTRDHNRRENMLGAIESATLDDLNLAHAAVKGAMVRRFHELTGEGGAR